ncbi:MAG: hypothetical protein L0287_32295 [Anaerolineae bacterium]|nr:hypothetical protein [Anaerolineae bacterium]
MTNKLQKLLGIDLTNQLKPTTSKLGDWYANLVPTYSGDLIVFVNEKTLLSVAIPIWESDNLLSLFRLRVVNLLGMIGIQFKAIENELSHYNHIQFGKTRSRSILGSMNDIAFHYQVMAEEAENKADLSLSNAEYKLSQMPCKPIDYRDPSDVVKELLVH